jgi:hypothetical protein
MTMTTYDSDFFHGEAVRCIWIPPDPNPRRRAARIENLTVQRKSNDGVVALPPLRMEEALNIRFQFPKPAIFLFALLL